MGDKISLIVPFYNSEKTIRKCLDSVINQTYDNFEALLINDGGSDSSEAIVREYMKKDSRIRLINNPHGGVSSARNTGLRNSTGEYIEFLDSDDHLEPTIMEKMMNTSKKYDADIVVCDYTHPTFRNYLGDVVIDTTTPEGRRKYYQTTFAVTVPWNKLFRKSVIDVEFDEDVSFAEDDYFGLCNMPNCRKVVGISDVLYHYYMAPKETSIEESSTINKMAKANEFWLSKDTYWYKRRELLQKSLDSLTKKIPLSEAEDYAYARIFDFMIWELLIFNEVGAPVSGIIYEIKGIFNDKDFIKSLEIRSKYGLDYTYPTKEELEVLVPKYVEGCIKIANDTVNYNLKIKPFIACCALLIKMFMKRNDKPLDVSDILAKVSYELENNLTEEAKYVHENF